MDYINLNKLYNKRFSCRTFDNEFIIPYDDIYKILISAYEWPSYLSLWGYKIIIVTDKRVINLVAKSRDKHLFIKNASMLVFFVIEPVDSLPINDFYKNELEKTNELLIDVSIAWTYLDLTATSLWYNTIWMSYNDDKFWKKILNIPDDYKLVYYIAIWKNKYKSKIKRSFHDISFWDKIFFNKLWK